MKISFPGGVWPTMVTPFKETNEIDYAVLEKAIEWYIGNQVDGLFAVCQSSEMFFLSLEERVKFARFVSETVRSRVPIIASGHVSDRVEAQIKELNLIAETGADAVILITNRLANQDEPDEIFLKNLEKILKNTPEDVPLGFYECPFPYKRIISPALLKWCADTGRFFFLKDTSCDVNNIQAKLSAIQGSELKLYNANTATLLETLKIGATGYSGVMANFHPDLYVWLMRNWERKPEEARHLSNFLSMASFIEKQLYPVNAKYYLSLEGIYKGYYCRSKNHNEFTATNRLEVEQLYELSKVYSAKYEL